jgi:hypothetical protein
MTGRLKLGAYSTFTPKFEKLPELCYWNMQNQTKDFTSREIPQIAKAS